MENAYHYATDKGLMSEQSYPYTPDVSFDTYWYLIYS